jgi:uncharacterized cupredoxin-like copper-binding protein
MNYRFLLSMGVVVGFLMIVLAACSGTSSTTPSNTFQVHVSLTDFKVQSSVSTFSPGQAYHFVVTNNGQTNHEFMIMQLMSGQMGNMQQMDKMALYHIDATALPPGASKSFDYTFPSSVSQQSLEFSCHLPGHYEAGMHQPIAVHA